VSADGDTLTGAPLLAAMLPGVITPVPFVKTPVRVADAPAAIDVGLTAKLVMVGDLLLGELIQPARLPKTMPQAKTQPARSRITFMRSPEHKFATLVQLHTRTPEAKAVQGVVKGTKQSGDFQAIWSGVNLFGSQVAEEESARRRNARYWAVHNRVMHTNPRSAVVRRAPVFTQNNL
jgi:hypothetical protein